MPDKQVLLPATVSTVALAAAAAVLSYVVVARRRRDGHKGEMGRGKMICVGFSDSWWTACCSYNSTYRLPVCLVTEYNHADEG